MCPLYYPSYFAYSLVILKGKYYCCYFKIRKLRCRGVSVIFLTPCNSSVREPRFFHVWICCTRKQVFFHLHSEMFQVSLPWAPASSSWQALMTDTSFGCSFILRYPESYCKQGFWLHCWTFLGKRPCIWSLLRTQVEFAVKPVMLSWYFKHKNLWLILYTWQQKYSTLSKEQPTLACQETRPLLGAVGLEDLIFGQGIPKKRKDGVMGGRLALNIRAVSSNIEGDAGLLCTFAKTSWACFLI